MVAFLEWAGRHPLLTVIVIILLIEGTRQIVLAVHGKDVDRVP